MHPHPVVGRGKDALQDFGLDISVISVVQGLTDASRNSSFSSYDRSCNLSCCSNHGIPQWYDSLCQSPSQMLPLMQQRSSGYLATLPAGERKTISVFLRVYNDFLVTSRRHQAVGPRDSSIGTGTFSAAPARGIDAQAVCGRWSALQFLARRGIRESARLGRAGQGPT